MPGALLCPLSFSCRISPRRQSSQQNPEKPSENEDRDVQEERARVQSALVSANHAEVQHNPFTPPPWCIIAGSDVCFSDVTLAMETAL